MNKEKNKSFRSFDTLLDEIPNLANTIPNLDNYVAHTPSSSTTRDPEPLQDHIVLVNQTALKLIKLHNIEEAVDKLIHELCSVLSIESEVEINLIKEIFLASINFHDFGKMNENFQFERMGNELFQKVDLRIGSKHSILSTYLFLNYYLEKLESMQSNKKNILAGLICAFADPILKHHSSSLQVKDLDKEECEELDRFLPMIGVNRPATFWPTILDSKRQAQESVFANVRDLNAFPLFTLLKLNFSILTAADYLATFSYRYDFLLPDSDNLDWWGLMTESFKMSLYNEYKKSKPYNKQSLEQPERVAEVPFHSLKEKNPENLNSLRNKMLGEAIIQIRNNSNERLFYLKAPTGAGKTNISLASVLELLRHDLRLNKVFYVFPFTTLITQTLKAIKETFDLNENFMVELHSKAEWSIKNVEEDKDGLYKNEWVNHLDNLFVHYPIVLLSHVKFFDILKSNHKEINYLMHRLANSIVIIDELQSYQSQFWDHVNYFISHYSKHFNIRFILMSATLPEIGKLAIGYDHKWINLLTNPNEYFRNPNFSGRVQFDYTLLEKGLNGTREQKLQQLADFIAKQAESYAMRNESRVAAIVEFITKKSAMEFLVFATRNPIIKEYEILLLSGTILEPRRRQVTDWIKDKKWKERHPKILLISTQVVEAGVDIDMDIGFKDTSLLDSEEQLAGRVNRNASKEDNQVFLFDMDQEYLVYKKGDKRLQIQNSEMTLDDQKKVLSTKEFERLYDAVIRKYIENRSQLIKYFQSYLV